MKITRNFLIAAIVAAPLLAQAPAAETWTVDKNHSSASFKVRHMMSSVTGQFRDFDAKVNINQAAPAESSVDFTIQAASIDTGSTNRDEHLRTPDFFDVAKYPTIAFKSTSITPKSKTEFDVTGDLTMHGVTKRVTLPVTFLGFMKTQRGEKAGFELETTLDRKDYGVIWNRNLDEGGVLLGDTVKISISLELDKKPAAAPAPAATK
jgi:polyisoprenoid-binding protein YceI